MCRDHDPPKGWRNPGVSIQIQVSQAENGSVIVRCPRCRAENPAGKQFCGDCGTSLERLESGICPTETLRTPVFDPARGVLFAGRYEIVEEIGEGGMGKVFRAIDTKLAEDVALKLVKPEFAADPTVLDRFSNELKLTRKIRHANVSAMYDLGEEGGLHFITMEYVPGEDLRSFIRRSGRLAVPKAVSIARQICRGLSQAHVLGVVHRDLKPSNIMIDREGSARIIDFGIARFLSAGGMTGSGFMIGTPEYMSPEQAEGKDIDQRSDLYSLGIILFEMLTGQLPFKGGTPLVVAIKHKTETPPDPKTGNPEVSAGLSRIILRCLAKDRTERYQNSAEVIADLDRIEQNTPAAERERVRRPISSSRQVTFTFNLKRLLVPAAVLLLLAVLAVLVLRH